MQPMCPSMRSESAAAGGASITKSAEATKKHFDIRKGLP
jgi:hypothetical protein